MKDTCYAQYIFRKSLGWTERERERERRMQKENVGVNVTIYYVMSTFVTYRH